MWALVTLILPMIKLFADSLKLFAVGFDVLLLGECVVAVTKVTLADFQQFIFPSSLRLPSPVCYVTLPYQPPPALPPVAVHQPFCLSLGGWDPPEGPAPSRSRPQQARPQPQWAHRHRRTCYQIRITSWLCHLALSVGFRVGLSGKAFA